MGAALPAISAATSIASAVGGFMEGQSASGYAQEAAKYQAMAAEIANKASKLKSQREKEQSLGKEREAMSGLLTNQSFAGNITTSAFKGSQASVASQYKSNLGFGNVMQQLQDLYAKYENQAIQYGSMASQASSNATGFSYLGQLGGSITQFAKLF